MVHFVRSRAREEPEFRTDAVLQADLEHLGDGRLVRVSGQMSLPLGRPHPHPMICWQGAVQ